MQATRRGIMNLLGMAVATVTKPGTLIAEKAIGAAMAMPAAGVGVGALGGSAIGRAGSVYASQAVSSLNSYPPAVSHALQILSEMEYGGPVEVSSGYVRPSIDVFKSASPVSKNTMERQMRIQEAEQRRLYSIARDMIYQGKIAL